MVKSVSGLWLTRAETRQIAMPILRGTFIGSALGILPGGGHVLSSFASYIMEKRISKHPETFGHGAIEGVAGPESANHAAAQTSFIPMLTLGLPAHPVMALMIGAFIIQGITPGPNVIRHEPELFWGIIVSMWIGNFFLIVLNLPLIGIWMKLLSVPYRLLFPAVVVFACIGTYSINQNIFDIYTIIVFGFIGYVLTKLDCEPAPMLLGFVLGALLEEHLRRSLIISLGDPMIFLTRPISGVLLAIAVIALIVSVLPTIAKRREVIFQDED
jgi:putative tricarboxylic transport membrane protein